MTSPASPLRARLEQLLAEATPGPWTYDPSEGDTVWCADEHRPSIIALTRDPFGNCEADAALIVAAVNALPVLLSVLRAVEELADEWEALVPHYRSLSQHAISRGDAISDETYNRAAIELTDCARAVRRALLPASPTTEED